MDTKGLMFPKPKDMNKEAKDNKKVRKQTRVNKRAIACDIPKEVRKKVLVRDKGMCIICGQAGLPNSHYVKRSQGGLGIEQNIVCMCIKCHSAYDDGNDSKKREEIKKKTKKYLKSKYGTSWKEKDLYYRKGESLK